MLSKKFQTMQKQKFFLNTLRTTLHSSKYDAMLFKKLHATFHRKKSCEILSLYSWDDIVQVKNLCNIVQDASDNIA